MDTLLELHNFRKLLLQYQEFVKDNIGSAIPIHSDKKIDSLRNDLKLSYSRLADEIASYGGKSMVRTDPLFGTKKDVFQYAFETIDILDYAHKLDAIDKSISLVNKAIGRLEKEAKSWRINPPKVIQKDKNLKPKAFISHSGYSQALTELRDYLDELDIEKLIVVRKPNLDRELNIKVRDYLDEADFVIVLATGDSTDRNGNFIPGGNVLHEIGLAQDNPKFHGKIIYLLEQGVEFPSNIKPKTYIRFNRENIDYKFGDIVKEIKAMGYIG